MQARPFASSGTSAMMSAEKSASKHQQRSGGLPVERAISIAQKLGSWQIGQLLGLRVCISKGFQLSCLSSNFYFNIHHIRSNGTRLNGLYQRMLVRLHNRSTFCVGENRASYRAICVRPLTCTRTLAWNVCMPVFSPAQPMTQVVGFFSERRYSREQELCCLRHPWDYWHATWIQPHAF